MGDLWMYGRFDSCLLFVVFLGSFLFFVMFQRFFVFFFGLFAFFFLAFRPFFFPFYDFYILDRLWMEPVPYTWIFFKTCTVALVPCIGALLLASAPFVGRHGFLPLPLCVQRGW